MKIGIITLPLHTNIGGILQAYALQKVVKDLDHDVETIALSPTRDYGRIFLLKRFVLKYILGRKNLDLKIKKNTEFVIKQRTQNTERFVQKYIKRRILNSYSQIKPKDYDVLVVGSDQVWRPMYFPESITNAYLDFSFKWNIKRIAYAVSFGTDKWEYTDEQTLKCSKLAKLFKAISVREDSGVELCKQKLGVNSVHVLDPTMLLLKEDYIKLIPSKYLSSNKRTLMYYVLDKTTEKENISEYICSELKLYKDDKTTETENEKVLIEKRIQISVEEWLSGFAKADFVFTDSFHGCAFSIIFNKPFIVYLNEGRGSARFYSLLKMFGLENRILQNNIDFLIKSDIDWSNVNRIIEQQRELSVSFIKENIK